MPAGLRSVSPSSATPSFFGRSHRCATWALTAAAGLGGLAVWPAHGAGFVSLDAGGSQLLALSSDGRSGAGSLAGGATGGFRWSDGRGVQPLPGAVSVRGISPSGGYVAGSSLDDELREVASYWTADGTLVRIGGLPDTSWQGGLVSIGVAVSDAPSLVGIARDADERSLAFEWTAERGVRALPLPADAVGAGVAGVSADGSRVYGWIESAPGARYGILWNGREPIGLREVGEVSGANVAATMLFGSDVLSTGTERVYAWNVRSQARTFSDVTAQRAPIRLLRGSDDARLVVGSAGSGGGRVAIVWTPQHGLDRLDHWLVSSNVSVPSGWRLAAATAISGDGRRIAGWGQHDGQLDSFVVDLP